MTSKALLLSIFTVLFALPLMGQIDIILPPDIFVCEGESVQLQAEVSGGDGNYTYLWSPSTGLSDTNISNPVAAPVASITYTLMVTDGLGEEATASVDIVVASVPQVVIEGQTEICEGFSAVLTVTTGAASYNWSIGATTASITVAPSVTTTYSVTITDFNGCSASGDITIVVNPNPELTTQTTDANCGQTNGTATAIINNGQAPFQYSWGNLAGTQTINFIPAGSYSVTVIDGNGCSAESVAVVNSVGTSISSVNIETTDTACGTAEGSATVTVEGGEEPYTYLWNNGAITATITNLEPGNYRVTVTENTGCTAIGMTQLGDASPMINLGQTVLTDVSCNGQSDGSIDLDVAGGSPQFTFAWSSGETTEDISGLAAGTYTVTVTGDNLCTDIETFTISEPSTLEIDVASSAVTDADCNGEASGSIDLSVNGGTVPYTYTWSNGVTTAFMANLTAGTYTVTATDANGCTDTETFTVDEPTTLMVDFDNSFVTDANCDLNNGAIDITVTGGTPPYFYTWNNGETLEDISNLDAGTYTVTITDVNACVAVANFTVNQITDLVVDAGADQVFCEGEEFLLTATVSGGIGSYSYLWSNGETTESISVAPTVDVVYTVVVTDENGCEAIDEVTLSNSLVVNSIVNGGCEGESNGSISLEVSGGAGGGFVFTWSDIGSTGSNGERTDLSPGSYTVTISDVICSTERTFDLVAETLIATQISIINTSCFGSNDGVALIDNPQPDYTYSWSNGAIGTTITNLTPGEYCVTATNETGCEQINCIIITEQTPIQVQIIGLPAGFCPENFTLEAIVTGGTAPYTFSWVNGSFTSNQASITGTFEGLVELTVTDANGCTFLIVTEIIDTSPTANTAASVAYISCDGSPAVLNGTGSSSGPDITYQWTGPNSFTSNSLIVEAPLPGQYLLTVIYEPTSGCETSAIVDVIDLAADFESGIDVALLACNDYRLSGIVPNNYDGPLTFSWTYPDATTTSNEQTITPTQTGVYTLRTEALGFGCEYFSTIYVDLDAMECATINGFVHTEEDETCLLDPNAPTLSNVQIIASGPSGSFSVFTDEDGYYEMNVPIDITTVEVITPSASWEACFATVDISSPSPGDMISASFWLKQLAVCPELSVNLTAGFLRRCFTSLYCLQVCNEGTEIAEAPSVTLLLDPFLSLSSASVSPTSQDGQLITWDLTSLAPGSCRLIYVWVDVSCDAELGQTHCSEAFATPDPLCVPTDNWSGTNLEVSGNCEAGEVQFTVRNTGSADLDETVQYIVIEDAVAMMAPVDLNDLGGDQEELFTFPANGSTYTFQIEQVDNHPYTTNLSISVEGCGTNSVGGFSTGFVTQYSQITATLASDIFCIENVGSYDPNDKATLPVGYGEQHYIVPETELYYRIRFQNTGTDTAFTVVIRDVLSELLDIRTLEPGNSTHDYELALTNERALTFTFNNILLPDSTTNLEASQGFVDFKIWPLADAPLESVIENSAAIYFDFNEPVLTNTVFHTLGRNFLEVVNVTVVPEINMTWEVYPNPATDQLQLKLDGELPPNLHLGIYDQQGRRLQTHAFAGSRYTLSVNDLPVGIYLLQLMDATDGRLLGSASLMKK